MENMNPSGNEQEKMNQAFREASELRDKKLNDEKEGLNAQLKHFEKLKKENEEDMKREFPHIDPEDKGAIPFADKEQEKEYTILKKEQEELTRDINKLRLEIKLVENNREN